MNEKELAPEETYLPIKIKSIHPLEPVPFNVFVLINKKYLHYLREGTSLTEKKLESLKKKDSDLFYIHAADKPAYKKYIHRVLERSDISPKDKAQILRESSQALVEELFESPDIESALTESKGIIKNFVRFMDDEPEAMGHLIGLSTHDFYTYNHSLDVGVYCLGLGNVLGFSLRKLQTMGEGALFHDIGKRHVPVEVICKNGPLNEEEWGKMKKHPDYGLAVLDKFEFITNDIKACCFEHHENFMGTGYPQGLQGEEIHPMARMIAITDTFDALTTQRSYNKPMTPREALDFMTGKLSSKYDSDMLKAMNEVLFNIEKEDS